MPKYAFLFLMGLLAVVLLLLFRRIRIRALAEPTPKSDVSGNRLPSGEPAEASPTDAQSEHPAARPGTSRPSQLVFLAAGVVIVSNLWVLISARVNRQQAEGGALELTEDELNLEPRLGESTVNLLNFHWRTSHEESRRCPEWLDAAKLAALGYDCHVPLSSALAADHYRRLGQRPVWLVLTISDPLFPPEGEPDARPTRLTVVDAGRERAPLREQYPSVEQYAVVPGVVHLRYLHPPQESAAPPSPVRLQGEIVTLLPSQLFVPRPFTARLDPLHPRASERTDPRSPPRFHARVAWGSQSIPWLQDVQLATRPEPASNTTP